MSVDLVFVFKSGSPAPCQASCPHHSGRTRPHCHWSASLRTAGVTLGPPWVSGFHLGTNQESSSERLQDCRDPSPNSGWNDRSIKWHKSNVKVLLHLGSLRTGPRGAGLSLQIWDRKPALFPPAWVCVTPLTTGAGSCSGICPPSECAAQARMIYNTLSPGSKKFRVRLKFNKFPGGLFRFACCLTDLAQIPPCCQAILGKPDTGAN